MEMPLIRVLASMEAAGVTVDAPSLERLSREVESKIAELSSRIFEIAKQQFNLNSPKQLRRVLFEDLGLPAWKKTKTGFSTNEEVLRKLSIKFPIAGFLLDYRQFSKLKSTYLMPLVDMIKNEGTVIHTHFNQMVTQTGRLSSSSPNLQNIPIRGEFAQKIRRIFIPSLPDGLILSSDYSQIELRVLAHFSQESNLMTTFKNSADIHTFTASLLFGIPQSEVNKKQRETAKRVNFGIIYGISPYGLARELNISDEEARIFIDKYFLRYPGVKVFIEKTINRAREKGYVKTLMGRIRYLPDISSSNHSLRDFSERQAVNTPIQGTAADIIKIAMVRISNEFDSNNIHSRLILQVHDELVFDVDSKELKKVVDIVKHNMENSISLSVPIVVNIKLGNNWLELNPL